jgi:oligopeptidase B
VGREAQDHEDGSKYSIVADNMDYGHGGASGRFDYLKGTALRYAFLLSLEGMNVTKETPDLN